MHAYVYKMDISIKFWDARMKTHREKSYQIRLFVLNNAISRTENEKLVNKQNERKCSVEFKC